ncbi:membrane protease FtsH catalytic subunit [Sporobacter termitidis DSM 10068]|uniref:ATP-dependent zinc metalloprotease FtsH n=1 Tax=Sporobacter termitidis DSM 10068 TaxID=1123282 RepID=A0A1M5YJM5_9FIRM|nr:ATP-dependent zinc metalloprotease FtsH [Sporobacter termitidis]SHI12237.1 membrane protease FtsH catalytic subunit [Sporobacter termitidis DSM 10068]
MKRKSKILLIIVAALLFLAALGITVVRLVPKQESPKPVYSDIIGYFQQDEVEKFSFNVSSGLLSADLRSGDTITYAVPDAELFIRQVTPLVTTYNDAHPDGKIVYDFVQGWDASSWLSALPYLLIFIAGIAFLVFHYGAAGRKNRDAMPLGHLKVEKAQATLDKKTFADVAGADEEKEELKELVEFLKNPGRFNRLGARIPKGVLLVGPPGTGKTLIAKAVSGEAGVPFFSISGSNFVEMYVGVGASRVRSLFEKAKKVAPCIVFIDEIDAVGRRRGAGMHGGNDEREQTLNQLLVEMDGFGSNAGVIVVAATNRVDILDPALLRPGRFDRQVYVGAPDIKGREAILRVHAREKPISSDVVFNDIAKATVGFTGADLENLLNEAALLAAKRGKQIIDMPDIEESIIKVVAGPEKKSRVISLKEKRLTAYHEAGHALVTAYLPSQKQVQQISIIPRGRMGGYTLTPPEEDKNFETRNEMLDEICIFLGGRVAESIAFDDISTGASNDIERATDMARAMVMKFGMSENLGPVKYGSDVDYTKKSALSGRVSSEIDAEIQKIIGSAQDKARDILTAHLDKLHAVAAHLCQHEKMSGAELKEIIENDQAEPAMC